MCIHSSEDIALNSKQQGLNLENTVELIFDPDYDGDISVASLTVMCITDMTRKNSQLHSIKGCKSGIKRQSRQREVPKTTTMMKVLEVIVLLPHISPGTLEWEKEISAQKTILVHW
jgi:hypothetical protein